MTVRKMRGASELSEGGQIIPSTDLVLSDKSGLTGIRATNHYESMVGTFVLEIKLLLSLFFEFFLF